MARWHERFDWLNRIRILAADPPGHRPIRKGEIIVQDLRTGALLEGVAAVRKIFQQVPVYLPLLPLLWINVIARRADADARGCG